MEWNRSKLCYFYGRDSVVLCEKYFLCFFGCLLTL
jgi:hypothetical protein